MQINKSQEKAIDRIRQNGKKQTYFKDYYKEKNKVYAE